MKLIITGGTGFLASNLLDVFLELDHSLIVISRSAKPAKYHAHENLEWIQHDLSESKLKSEELISCDNLYHFSGATLGANLDQGGYCKANEETLINLMESDIKANQIIFPSSQVVYGNINKKNINEDEVIGFPESAYSASKINTENWIALFQKKFEVPVVIFRMSGFIEGGGVIDYIIDEALADNDIELFSKGLISRDYLLLNDVINLLVSISEKQFSKELHIFNLGSGEDIQILQIAKIIVEALGSKSKIRCLDQKARMENFVFDIDKVRSSLNFHPTSLIEGIVNYAQLKKENKLLK